MTINDYPKKKYLNIPYVMRPDEIKWPLELKNEINAAKELMASCNDFDIHGEFYQNIILKEYLRVNKIRSPEEVSK